MSKIIVTGADGFVGRYLVELLKKNPENEIIGLDRKEADITDFNSVDSFIQKNQPDRVYHLAGFASGAGKDQDLIFKVNVDGTENILKSLSGLNRPVKILLASTAYVYGNTPTCVGEDGHIDAKSFYDKSKVEMEKMSKKYLSSDLQIVITRATNHTGPGQKPGFAVPDFAAQIVKANPPAGGGDEILVGNLDAKRDLFDVRDCVKAYQIVMEQGQSGEIYNIGTSNPITMKEVLEKLIKISGKNIKHEIDPKKMRPSDISQNCVNAEKTQSLGWQPEISIDTTLKDVIEYFSNLKEA